jgi:hypothetical protein
MAVYLLLQLDWHATSEKEKPSRQTNEEERVGEWAGNAAIVTSYVNC